MSHQTSLQGAVLYLDASALVKRYIAEPGTSEVAAAIAEADAVGTSLITRAEVAAALSEAVRVQTLPKQAATSALQVFRSEWPNLVRVQATEMVIARADTLAWQLGLRGYDAVHLASALLWQESLNRSVAMAVFDLDLWQAAEERGLIPFPHDLPGLLQAWVSSDD